MTPNYNNRNDVNTVSLVEAKRLVESTIHDFAAAHKDLGEGIHLIPIGLRIQLIKLLRDVSHTYYMQGRAHANKRAQQIMYAQLHEVIGSITRTIND